MITQSCLRDAAYRQFNLGEKMYLKNPSAESRSARMIEMFWQWGVISHGAFYGAHGLRSCLRGQDAALVGYVPALRIPIICSALGRSANVIMSCTSVRGQLVPSHSGRNHQLHPVLATLYRLCWFLTGPSGVNGMVVLLLGAVG